jgi:YhcH/YjgK/YiaL family protein
MILDTLANADRYLALHPLFPRAFEFLRGTDLAALTPGRHVIDGEALFAIVEASPGRSRTEAKLECHRRYVDIQLVLEGTDEMGWRPLGECHQPVSEFNVERDIRFFDDVPASWVSTPAGSFCIFFPEDAHAPLVSDGIVRKVVLKIER